jgi:hypothetical protein
MQRRDPDRAIAPTESFCLTGRKLVTLIEYLNLWNLIEREALEYVIDRGDMGIHILGSRINHMQQEIGIAQLIQCRSESCNEIFREVTDKSHRVGEDHFTAMGEMQPAARGIERFKGARRRAHLAIRQYIEQCRLAGVRVAYDGQDWKCLSDAARSTVVLVTGKACNLSL